MEKYSFYTPEALATCVFEILPDRDFKSIADICCGSGNLIRPAHKKWPKAQVFGSDISSLDDSSNINPAACTCVQKDGRQYALECWQSDITFDLLLSNPPFGRLPYKDSAFSAIDHPLAQHLNGRYESEMLLSNMLLEHEGSILLCVMPSTVIEGESFRKVRNIFLADHRIHAIVQLPNNTFPGCEVRSHIIISEKVNTPPSDYGINCYIATQTKTVWKLKHSGTHDISTITVDTEPPKKSGIAVKRGNISSNLFCKTGVRVYHCSSIFADGRWTPSIRFIDSVAVKKTMLYADPGDVVINRIGKNCGYWMVNESQRTLISDCILLVKHGIAYIDLLNKHSKQGRLNVAIRGITTRFISAQDIIAIFG